MLSATRRPLHNTVIGHGSRHGTRRRRSSVRVLGQPFGTPVAETAVVRRRRRCHGHRLQMIMRFRGHRGLFAFVRRIGRVSQSHDNRTVHCVLPDHLQSRIDLVSGRRTEAAGRLLFIGHDGTRATTTTTTASTTKTSTNTATDRRYSRGVPVTPGTDRDADWETTATPTPPRAGDRTRRARMYGGARPAYIYGCNLLERLLRWRVTCAFIRVSAACVFIIPNAVRTRPANNWSKVTTTDIRRRTPVRRFGFDFFYLFTAPPRHNNNNPRPTTIYIYIHVTPQTCNFLLNPWIVQTVQSPPPQRSVNIIFDCRKL